MRLARLFKKLGKQYKTPGVGAFKETMAQALWWGTPINFAMIAGTFYYTTIRHIAPWVNPYLFFIVLGVGLVVALVVEYKFILPSLWSFREKQMFSHQSEVMDELKRLKKLITDQKKEEEK